MKEIDRILEYYKFPNFDVKHIEMLVVIENEDNKIVAVSSLSTILESVFVPSPDVDKRTKIESLKVAVNTARKSVDSLGYTSFHALGVKVPTLAKALLKKLGFQKMVGENFILFVK